MSEKESLNYETFLDLTEWSLDFAISLIRGDNPMNPARDESGKVLMQNKGGRTWKIAEADIKNGCLGAVRKTKFEEPDFQEFFFDYEYSEETYFVIPKDFVRWCNENGMVVEPELNQYFDYRYWISKKYWKFDEAVMVILSDNIPPLPKEIKNVFEIDDEHFRCAKNLEKLLKNCYGIAFKINSAGKEESFFTGTAPISRGLLLHKDKLLSAIKSKKGESLQLVIKPREIDIIAGRYLRWETEGSLAKKVKMEKFTKSEASYDDRINYTSLMNKALWSIDEALDTINSLNPDDKLFSKYNRDFFEEIVCWSFETPQWLLYRINNRHDSEKLLLHDFKLGTADFLIEAHLEIEGEQSLSGSVKPKDFIKWAKGHELRMPTGLENKQKLITHQDLNEYTTPYITLMLEAIEEFRITKENQPEVQKLREYLEEGLRKITDDPNHQNPANKAKVMATFLRLPESQKGGNTQYKK